MSAAFVYDAIRTPFGRYGKALAGVRPDDLAALVVRELVARHPDLDPSRIDDVILGDANQAGEDNRSVARMAVLLAGLPVSVPGSTVNRLCGSGMDAIIGASRAIEVGDAEVILAGGVESMSRSPWVTLKPTSPYPIGNSTLTSTAVGWRFVNPAMPRDYVVDNGEGAEILAERFGISREEQDSFALRSHQQAAAAWDAGRYAEVVPVPGVDLPRDEGIRTDSSLDALAALKPAFRTEGGTVTAGNSSPLNDGASLTLIAGENPGFEAEPLARIAGRGVAGNEPALFGIAPVEAAARALKRAGRTWSEVDVVELNEAFAAQSLACLKGWPDLDPDKLNPDGGAIAIGHPLGASGGRIVGHLAHTLRRRGGGVGVAAICIGVGQALAVVLEA
ncbi:MAG TPA: thiolase family protein [Pseudolysinimonas sp.]|jgi:acetyl-CoA acetyltransferase family protein